VNAVFKEDIMDGNLWTTGTSRRVMVRKSKNDDADDCIDFVALSSTDLGVGY
jgi:hypothetical protein